MIYNYPYYNPLDKNHFSQGNYYYPQRINYKYNPVQNNINQKQEILTPVKTQRKNMNTKSDINESKFQQRAYNYEINKNDINAQTPFSSGTNTFNKDENSYLFEILGTKLYFDDILLLCLIFFLYNEGVKDQSLFMILILLLLS